MFQASIRQGIVLTVFVLIMCVLGMVAAFRIPIQMIPDLEVRTISVVTGWPGATPQDIEKEILIEQERYLRTVPNLQRMTSLSETGRASIEMEFPFGVDINEALIQVSNALSQVSSYPENVDQPRLLSSSFSQNAFMYFSVMPLPGNPFKIDMDMMYDFVDDHVRPRMERVSGISEVQIRGGSQRQIQIQLDPAQLAQRGLTFSDVRDAVRQRNRDTSAGDIDSGKRRYLMRTIGRFDDVEDLENLILTRQGNANVRLKDVGSVKLDHFEVRNVSYQGTENSIRLAVNREAGSNVIQIKTDLLPIVEAMKADLLAANGLTIELIGDDVRYVQESIKNVWTNLALGALLATLVLFLFLRSARATLVGVMSIPICTIAAFVGLLAFDRTINVISLAGVAFAIGMTVDNTIVVLESIEQARRRGLKLFDAALLGVRDVWPAVLASSLTTVLVFAPVLFVQEEAGQLYSDIAIAISSAILASMLVAVTVVPSATARLGFGSITNATNLTPNTDEPHSRNRILHGITWLIDTPWRRTVCLISTLLLTLGVAATFMPPAEYLPEGEEPKAFSRMIAPPGYNQAEMSRIGKEVRTLLDATVNADPQAFERGETPFPALKYYSLSVSSSMIWVMSEPIREEDINPMMDSLTKLFRSYPGMRAFASRGSIISSNNGGTRAVNLDISGSDLNELYAAAENAYQRTQTLFDNPQIQSEPSSLSLDQPLVEVKPNWERLAEYQYSSDDFGYAVAALSDGAYVDEFFLNDDKVDIFIQSSAGQNQQLDQLGQLPIMTPSGIILPLNALATLNETVDSTSVRRVDGRRTVTLRIIPPRDVALATAVAKVQHELIPTMQAEGEISNTVSMDISGAADQLEATRNALSGNFIVAVVIIYLLLVAIFQHWGYPLIILTTIPLGLAGGLVGLILLNGAGTLLSLVGLTGIHQPFDMITMLGFLILLGTVVNNPILIVDQTRKNLVNPDTPVKDAVISAIDIRLRPILMSSLTTIFGLAPLVLIPGAGTELYRGVGIVVLMGIFCSTIITLTFLPCLLMALFQRRELRRQPAQL
ncbi:efflux RND transporter permease subunit [Aestuariicella hydrocarbonica]|uniref:Efflux RND transporter permease subunit n=1 Tax=Pseudomaricurvus hydrocarbonicus TaxID=1470433 RepID=A0A9E5MFY4_9GAMM|nr:efflux RND transporter permease subunit [Aestuariicella hydrocarbonica]NHO63996.1 efflux RND transporter permease subunit [Aestuariicella hydrocarbonica]